jgi:hypothetical protein
MARSRHTIRSLFGAVFAPFVAAWRDEFPRRPVAAPPAPPPAPQAFACSPRFEPVPPVAPFAFQHATQTAPPAAETPKPARKSVRATKPKTAPAKRKPAGRGKRRKG